MLVQGGDPGAQAAERNADPYGGLGRISLIKLQGAFTLRELGGRTPLQMTATEPGAREVERVLGRIEHGIFG